MEHQIQLSLDVTDLVRLGGEIQRLFPEDHTVVDINIISHQAVQADTYVVQLLFPTDDDAMMFRLAWVGGA